SGFRRCPRLAKLRRGAHNFALPCCNTRVRTHRPVMTTAATRAPVPISRDLRLDFFRGLALVFIFIDHIPDNLLSNLTLRNLGFSDATEMFVYISGYTAGLVYMAAMLREGWL